MNWKLHIALALCCGLSGCSLVRAQERPGALSEVGQTKVEEALKAGDTTRAIIVDERERTFLIHVPPKYDKSKPTPLVVAYHGLGLPASMMPSYTKLDETADKYGFIVVYPAGITLSWNAGARRGPLAEARADDVKFTREMVKDLEKVLNIDKRRVFATGMSNGGMLCYKLANEASDLFAAIAPVSGTMTYSEITSKRPVPVIHFHGTDDGVVGYDQKREMLGGLVYVASAPDTIAAWVKFDGCKSKPIETDLPDKESDGTTVTKRDYGTGRDGVEVVLYTIKGGGHTWPGVTPPAKNLSDRFLGLATFDISANELMWEFFAKHPMPEAEKAAEKVPGARDL